MTMSRFVPPVGRRSRKSPVGCISGQTILSAWWHQHVRRQDYGKIQNTRCKSALRLSLVTCPQQRTTKLSCPCGGSAHFHGCVGNALAATPRLPCHPSSLLVQSTRQARCRSWPSVTGIHCGAKPPRARFIFNPSLPRPSAQPHHRPFRPART